MGAAYVGSVGRDGAGGHCLQPTGVFGRQYTARPLGSASRDGIKAFHIIDSAAGFVVVPAYEDLSFLPHPIDDFVWVRSITDHVAEVPDGIVRGRGREDGVERVEIGVNVREDEDTHLRQPRGLETLLGFYTSRWQATGCDDSTFVFWEMET